jgi:hypothetical protein
LVLNTETGAIILASPGMPDDVIVPPRTPPFALIQTGAPPVVVWSFEELWIPPEVSVQLSSKSRAVAALAATTRLTILGPMDFSGNGGRNGGPNEDGANTPDSENGGGGGAPSGSGGGGGGGHAAAGGNGAGTTAGDGGPAMGTGMPDTLFFGGGGGGGSGTGTDGNPGFGGSGGGAIALLGLTVELNSAIDVRGIAGLPAGGGDAGGGGGGAGGGIFVSGGKVILGPNLAMIATGGMGGGGSGTGGTGGDGANGRIRVLYDEIDDTSDPMSTTPSMDKKQGALVAFPVP